MGHYGGREEYNLLIQMDPCYGISTMTPILYSFSKHLLTSYYMPDPESREMNRIVQW